MLIKFINRGTGMGKSAQEYLLQKNDHKGEVRADIKVLRGNPQAVTDVIDSLDFKHKYRSAVIAWHKDDMPTDEQIAQVLDDFERVSFAGLEPNQYCYYAVQHEESDGSKHVHIVVPRVELQSGLSMNIAPPNWQKTYDVLRDKYNVKNQWASPADLERRQSLTLDKSMIHGKLNQNEAKQLITQLVNDAVANELVKNRDDVLAYLSDLGEVTRQGKDYISLKPNGFKKAIRLKGAVYEREFSIERFNAEIEREKEQRTKPNQAIRSREYERVSNVLEDIINDRAKFNRGRYDKKAQQPTRENDRSSSEHHQGRERSPKDLTHQSKGDREQSSLPNTEREQNQAKVLASSVDSGSLNHTRASDRNVGARSGNLWTHPDPYSDERRDRPSPNSQRGAREVSSDSEDVQQRDRAKERAKRMAEQGRELDSSVREDGGVDHDAIRKRIKRELENTREFVQTRVSESNESLRDKHRAHKYIIQKANERSIDNDRTAGWYDKQAEQDVGEVSEHIEEHSNKHRRGTATAVTDQSQQLDKATGRIGRARQGFVETVKRSLEKAIEKVKEIAKKITHTQSSGWGMSP